MFPLAFSRHDSAQLLKLWASSASCAVVHLGCSPRESDGRVRQFTAWNSHISSSSLFAQAPVGSSSCGVLLADSWTQAQAWYTRIQNLFFLIDSDLEFITSWCQVSFPQSLLTHHWTVQDAFLYADDSDEIIEELLSREKKKADRTRRRSEQQDGQVQDDLDSITKGEKWKDLHMTIAASRSVPRNSLCRRRSGVCFMKEKYFWKFDAVSFV